MRQTTSRTSRREPFYTTPGQTGSDELDSDESASGLATRGAAGCHEKSTASSCSRSPRCWTSSKRSGGWHSRAATPRP